MSSLIEPPVVAQQILEVIPLVMRTLASELRRSEHDLAIPHFRLLWMLRYRSFTLSELADHQFVSLPTMSNSMTILEERGWVRRSRSNNDRRKVLIELSPAGLAVLESAQRHAEARVAEILSPLGEHDKQILVAGLLVLRDAFARVEYCPLPETAT